MERRMFILRSSSRRLSVTVQYQRHSTINLSKRRPSTQRIFKSFASLTKPHPIPAVAPAEMSSPPIKVLISGAGITGPCLAYWLARTNPKSAITVIERSPVPRATGQAVDIRGSAIDIIKQMNLEEAIRAHGTTEIGTRFIDSDGKTFAEFSDGESFTAEYEILRADLCELFLKATEPLCNVKYVYGDSIETLVQDEKQVNVTFAKGTKETFDLVVGADGSTSKTRSLIFDETVTKDSYKFLGQYIGFFSIPRTASDTKYWQWYNTTNGLSIMIRPHRNPNTMGAYLGITTPARGERIEAVEQAMAKGVAGQKAILREVFANAGWEAQRVLEGMDRADDFYMSHSAQVVMPKWTKGRVVLLGDAAFATFGIGTALAIQSSYVLAGELSKIESSRNIPEALERYEAVFRPLHEKMGNLPSFYPQMVFPQTTWGLWIRDSILWVLATTKIYRLMGGGPDNPVPMPSYGWPTAKA